MELMQSQHTDGFSGSHLSPDFLKPPDSRIPGLLQVSSFGFWLPQVSIYRHVTLAQSTRCRGWVGCGTMCGAEMEGVNC